MHERRLEPAERAEQAQRRRGRGPAAKSSNGQRRRSCRVGLAGRLLGRAFSVDDDEVVGIAQALQEER